MKYAASEKLKIIRLGKESHLSACRTLAKLGIPRTTFYRWYARQVARYIARPHQYEVSMKQRKKVAMLCANLKRILGLGWLRLRRPCGANDEFLLAATAQNLRKLAKIYPAPQKTRKA